MLWNALPRVSASSPAHAARIAERDVREALRSGRGPDADQGELLLLADEDELSFHGPAALQEDPDVGRVPGDDGGARQDESARVDDRPRAREPFPPAAGDPHDRRRGRLVNTGDSERIRGDNPRRSGRSLRRILVASAGSREDARWPESVAG